MSHFRISIVMALTALLVALAGLATPSEAKAAPTTLLRCESTGGGRFVCDASAGPNALYSWKAVSNAVITQRLGTSVFGNCTIGTTAKVSVSISYRVGGHRLGGPKVTASFPCTAIAL
jgi:hypothetical protein